MEVRFYNLDKRVNSTKKPAAGSAVQTYTGKLREPSGIINPSIGFDLGHNTSPAAYNYAYIPLFDRFYYVSDWTWEEGLWYAQLQVDALASWRDGIRSSMQYVLRSSDTTSSGWNGDLIDTMYPAKAVHVDLYGGYLNNPWPINTDPAAGGYYTVGIANQDGAALGGTSYYVMTNTQFRTLVQKLLASTDWTGYTDGDSDLTESVYKSLFNPLQYISSCVWSPVTPPLGAAVSNLTFGWWSVPGTSATRLNGTTTVTGGAIALPKHPQAASRGSYLNGPPYTRLTLVNGPFGDMVLNPALYTNRTNAYVEYIYDHITGRATCRVGPDAEQIDYHETDQSQTIQFGVPIKISQITQDFIGVANGLLDSVSGGLSGALSGLVTGGPAGALGGMIAGTASGMISAASAILPQIQSVGATGSFSGFAQTPRLQGQFWLVADEDRANLGRPLCASVTLSALQTGSYVKILEPDISLAATAGELDTIRENMAAGMFLE